MDFSNTVPSANGKPAGGFAAYDTAVAALEFTPIPPGIYVARVLRGECTTTKAGEDAYRMRFEVTEGPQTGKTVLRTWTFGPKALGYTKHALTPFGLTTTAELLSPFPPAGREYLVRLVVALQRGNDGREFNDIKRIEIIRVDESPAAAFMLPREGEGGPK